MAEHWSLAYKINVLDNKKGNLEMVWCGIFTDAGFIAVYSACYSNLQFSLCPVPYKVWEHFDFFALSPICTGAMHIRKDAWWKRDKKTLILLHVWTIVDLNLPENYLTYL